LELYIYYYVINFENLILRVKKERFKINLIKRKTYKYKNIEYFELKIYNYHLAI